MIGKTLFICIFVCLQSINSSNILKSHKKYLNMLQCFLCRKDFTASCLPIHEQRCLSRWNIENGQNFSREDWNTLAWNVVKYGSSPCKQCGCHFKPDELISHLRKCKPPFGLPFWPPTSSASTSFNKMDGPVSVTWEVGEAFGVDCGKIKEYQTWKAYSSCYSALKEPVKLEANSSLSQNLRRQVYERATLPCYLCGKKFSEESLCLHEMECFEQRRERSRLVRDNDVLVLSDDDEDNEEALDEIWENQLPEQRLCRKCGILYFSNNIAKHEIMCVGAPTNIKPENGN